MTRQCQGHLYNLLNRRMCVVAQVLLISKESTCGHNPVSFLDTTNAANRSECLYDKLDKSATIHGHRMCRIARCHAV